jgi:hypothetical protein
MRKSISIPDELGKKAMIQAIKENYGSFSRYVTAALVKALKTAQGEANDQS